MFALHNLIQPFIGINFFTDNPFDNITDDSGSESEHDLSAHDFNVD